MLNQLHRLLPEGLLADAAWFTRMGYSSSLRGRYVAGGWLEPIVRGVFRRPPHRPGLRGTAPLHWQHVVVSLQTVMERPIAVGGRTALEFAGFTHYSPKGGPPEVKLYGDVAAPTWLGKLPVETEFVFHRARKLFSDGLVADALEARKAVLMERGADGEASLDASLHWLPFSQRDWPILLSSPERAVLELLDELPGRETFHQADMLMESLVNLGPERMGRLLRDCRSVKVKRLFLWFAERHGHAWFKRLDLGGIDLGSGKRMLVRGGRLDTRYGITVPRNLDAGG